MAKDAIWEKIFSTAFDTASKMITKLNRTYPLCVTRTCRRPSLRNMSMTVSMGVWSVTVMGARSRMRLNLTGGDPCQGDGIWGVNKTNESSLNPSWVRLALAGDLIEIRFNIRLANKFRCDKNPTNCQRKIAAQNKSDQKLRLPGNDDRKTVVICFFEQRVDLLQTGRVLSKYGQWFVRSIVMKKRKMKNLKYITSVKINENSLWLHDVGS